MNKKIFLTETDKKKIISEKERMIIESFAKNFNKIKRIDENEITSSNLTQDDQKILDDILSINEGLDFNTVIDKVKKYAKMGLLNTAIVMSLLGNPTFTQAQKDQIQNIANIEQTIDNKELSLKDLKNIIKKDDFKASVGRAPLDMVYNKEKGNIDTKFRVYRSVAKNEAAASNSAIIIMRKNEETTPKITHQFTRTLDNGNIEVMIAIPVN